MQHKISFLSTVESGIPRGIAQVVPKLTNAQTRSAISAKKVKLVGGGTAPCTGTGQYTWNILIPQHLMVLILR
jgi:hypothetical protein